MISLSERDLIMITAPLFKVPVFSECAPEGLWPDSDAGRENKTRRLQYLCAMDLLRRHTAVAHCASRVELFYHWAPWMPQPEIGAYAWELAKRWEKLEPRNVVFYTATDRAAKHYGRTIHNPLRSISALSHNINFAKVYFDCVFRRPLLAKGWVAEDVIASVRGHGEKVVDACIVDSTSTPALIIEFAGASYASSAGARLREIHTDCAARGTGIPYEIWTVADGGTK